MPKSSTYTPAPPRFQIATRLGALRDTCTVPDPFGTTATFTLYRSGCQAHREWFRKRLDKDPQILLMAERAISENFPVLTLEEEKTLDKERENDVTPNPLLPIVDRLVIEGSQSKLQSAATRSLLESGRLKPSDLASRDEDDRLDEALFTVKGWSDVPGDAETIVPFTPENARSLLTSDVELEEGAGIDDILHKIDAWMVDEIQTAKALPEGISENSVVRRTGAFVSWKTGKKIVRPGLTLGLAYQLYFLACAKNRSLFRDEVMSAAAKNYEPSSDSSSSSGDGENGAAN